MFRTFDDQAIPGQKVISYVGAKSSVRVYLFSKDEIVGEKISKIIFSGMTFFSKVMPLKITWPRLRRSHFWKGGREGGGEDTFKHSFKHNFAYFSKPPNDKHG